MASRDSNKPRAGYTQLLSGTDGYHSLTTARAVNLDIHHKHCYQICRFLRGKTAGYAIEYLEQVIKADGWIEIEVTGPHSGQEVLDTEDALKKWLKEVVGLVPDKKENWYISNMEVHSLAELKERSGIETTIF